MAKPKKVTRRTDFDIPGLVLTRRTGQWIELHVDGHPRIGLKVCSVSKHNGVRLRFIADPDVRIFRQEILPGFDDVDANQSPGGKGGAARA